MAVKVFVLLEFDSISFNGTEKVIQIIQPEREACGPEGPALRALGLLLADGAPTVGWGKTF